MPSDDILAQWIAERDAIHSPCATCAHAAGAHNDDGTCRVTGCHAHAYDQAIAYATERGAQDGANAAHWYLQDTLGGRVTGDPVKAARYILRGIDDGDSAVTDGFPFADLSGEWADSYSSNDLMMDAGVSDDSDAAYGDPDAPESEE